jgi:hypothetical protein
MWEVKERYEWCADCRLRGERRCRYVIQELLGVKFPETTYRGYRVEGLNLKLKLVFEYNGRQHYEYVRHWQKTREGLRKQRERDERLLKTMAKDKISIIVVPQHYANDYPQVIRLKESRIKRARLHQGLSRQRVDCWEPNKLVRLAPSPRASSPQGVFLYDGTCEGRSVSRHFAARAVLGVGYEPDTTNL